MHAGAAIRGITPDPDPSSAAVWLAGFSRGRRARSVHDELQARALVLDDGACRVALVTVDLIGLFRDQVLRLRESPRFRALDIDHLVVAATHTHSGPDTLGLWGPDPGISGVTPGYRSWVRRRILAALAAACRALEPVRPRFASTRTPGLIRDRVEPLIVDDRLELMQLERVTGEGSVAVLVSWANHPEVLWEDNRTLSADYPCALRCRLEQAFGGVGLFVPGAIGGLMTPDQVPVLDPVSGRPAPERSVRKMTLLGRQVAEQGIAALRAAAPADVDAIEYGVETFALPLGNARLRAALQAGVFERDTEGEEGGLPRLVTEASILRLGPADLIAVPGELCPELVLGGVQPAVRGDDAWSWPALEEMLPGSHRFVLGLANDELGYIVPPSQWPRDRDGLPEVSLHSAGIELAPRLFEVLGRLLGKKCPVRDPAARDLAPVRD